MIDSFAELAAVEAVQAVESDIADGYCIRCCSLDRDRVLQGDTGRGAGEGDGGWCYAVGEGNSCAGGAGAAAVFGVRGDVVDAFGLQNDGAGKAAAGADIDQVGGDGAV